MNKVKINAAEILVTVTVTLHKFVYFTSHLGLDVNNTPENRLIQSYF